MGWTGAAIPEEYGGAGLGHLAVCVLAEEIGYAVAPVPFASSVYLAAEAILRFRHRGAEADVAAETGDGRGHRHLRLRRTTRALWTPRKLDTTVADGKLTGTKIPVADGDMRRLRRRGRAAAAPALHVVDLHGPGVTRETVATIDPTRSHARLAFAGAPAETLPSATAATSCARCWTAPR